MLLIPTMFQVAATDVAQPTMMDALFQQLIFIVPIVAIFYFLIIRPQNQRAKKMREMLAALRKGDTVVTNGGIIGRIVKLADDEVTIDTGEGGKLRVIRGVVMDVRTKGDAPANDVKEG